MKLAIDIDGCLADFSSAYGDLLIKVSGRDLLPVDRKTNPDWPTTWYWERAAGYTKEIESEVWNNHILKTGTFWEDLEPMEHASGTVRRLNALSKHHDIYFITQRMGVRAKLQTEKWLYELGMDYPTVCLVTKGDEKVAIMQALGISFFVDDKAETVVDASRLVDPAEPSKFQLYVKDAPYNRVQYPAGKVTVVGSVKESLEKAGLWT